MFQILYQYFPAFLDGASVTLAMAAFAWVVGILLGFALGYAAIHSGPTHACLVISGTLVGSIPVIATLFWFHYPFQVSLGLVLDPFWVSCFVLAFINALLVADIVANAGRQIPSEFLSCARVYGVSSRQTLTEIELPMILRSSIPAILNIQVAVLHMTLFASLISVNELFRTAQRINAIENRVVEIYTLLALFYIVISLPIILSSRALKTRYSYDLSER